MVEKGWQSPQCSLPEEELDFLTCNVSQDSWLNCITDNGMTVDAFEDFCHFSEVSFDTKLKQNLNSYVEKYKNSQKPLELCTGKFCDMESTSFLNELWNAGSQTYAIPRQNLWADSCVNAILSFVSQTDCNDALANAYFCSDVQDELYDLFDMHKLCENAEAVNYDEEEIIQTADEVIEEIEGILQFSDGQIDAGADDDVYDECKISLANFNGELENFENFFSNTPMNVYHGALLLDKTDNERSKSLKRMTMNEIIDELEDLEASVKLLSESLLVELNMRDELIFEKEIRNTFITKILEVQYKQEQLKEGAKSPTTASNSGKSRFGKLTRSFSMGNASELTAGRFLTTVIPYQNGGVPSLENLQVLIRLLDAIKQDSTDVPALITDYILNVLCPAPAANQFLKF